MSREARLLLQCARLDAGAGGRERILAAARAGLDWPRLLAMADFNGVLPLLHRHLDRLPADAVPAAARAALWARHAATSRRNREMTQELLRILALFETQRIDALAYKGPALAAQAYGDVALREFGDLDILVRPRDVLRAKALLERDGYAADYPLRPAVQAAFLASSGQYHLVMTHAARGMVELHWKTDPDFPVERSEDDAWWAGLARAPLEGSVVRCFPSEELLLVLLLHGAKHHWSSLGWLVDVAELVARGAAIEWRWIADSAARLGCERRVALGLHLARRLLDTPLPAPALAMIAAHPEVEALGERIRARLLVPEYRDMGALEALRFNLDLYERWRQRVRHCVGTLLAPSLVEWTRWPLPRALFFLYPALRLMRLSRKHLLR